MTNEQILLGLMGLLLTASVAAISFVLGKARKNGASMQQGDPAGARSTDFWLRQFDKLIEAQVRCETRQEQVIDRLDRLIEIMEAK